MLKIVCLFLLFGFLAHINATRTVNTQLNANDLTRLQKVFSDGIKSSDLQSLYYSAINYAQLNSNEKKDICSRITKVYSDSKLNDFEKNFYLVASLKFAECAEKPAGAVLDAIKTSFTKDISTPQEIYYNFFAAKAINFNLDEGTKQKLAKNLQTLLKKDDSLNNLGYSFAVAAELGSAGTFAYDRVEDAIVQADEVDGKYLQFEGGLSVTALLIANILKITSNLNKPAPISPEQAVKFANYFLSRRSVQTAKGASVLLESLRAIAQDKSIAPISIQLNGNGQLTPDNLVLSVKVSDVLGVALKPALAALSTTVTAKQGNVALLTKTNLVPSNADSTVFTLDLKSVNPNRGIHNVVIDAGIYKQSLSINVLGKVKVNLLEIGVGDLDSSSAIKKLTVTYPNKLGEKLQADTQQKIVLKTVLVDEKTNKPVTVHQAFVRLYHKQSKDEIIFVAEQDNTKAYKFDMDVGARSADFGHQSGVYGLDLIIGDASLSNSFKWELAEVELKFPSDSKREQTNPIRSTLPEIHHQFREPEKRPSRFVSDLFTGLCLIPLVILFILWGKLGANIKNFPFSLSAIGFHLGLGSILTLFGVFWLRLNMFDTIRYLLVLGLITFLCGNKLLRYIASKKQ